MAALILVTTRPGMVTRRSANTESNSLTAEPRLVTSTRDSSQTSDTKAWRSPTSQSGQLPALTDLHPSQLHLPQSHRLFLLSLLQFLHLFQLYWVPMELLQSLPLFHLQLAVPTVKFRLTKMVVIFDL